MSNKIEDMAEKVRKMPYKKRMKYVLSQLSKEEIIKGLSGYGYMGYDESFVLKPFTVLKEYMLPAVKINGDALKNASKELQNDEEVVLAAVSNRGSALEYASAQMKSNKTIVLAAVKEKGYALEFASENLKGDYEVVLTAVAGWGRALKYAKRGLNDNETIVNAAIKNDPLAIVYATSRYKRKRENILKAIKEYKDIDVNLYYQFKYSMSAELINIVKYYMNDKEVLLEFASCNYGQFSDFLDTLNVWKKNDIDIVTTHVKANPDSYRNLSTKFKQNIDVVEKAIEGGYPVDLVDPKYINNRNLIFKSVNVVGCHLGRYPDYQDDDEIVFAAVKKDGNALEFASDRLKNNKFIVTEAVKNVAQAFYHASEDLKQNIDFQIELLKVNPFVINYACKDLQKDFIEYYKKTFTNEKSGMYAKYLFNDYNTTIEEILGCICRYDEHEKIMNLIISDFIKYVDSKDKIDGLDIATKDEKTVNLVYEITDSEEKRTSQNAIERILKRYKRVSYKWRNQSYY